MESADSISRKTSFSSRANISTPDDSLFDRDAARKAAEAEVERARRAQEAVLRFHDASEKIEEAQKVVRENSAIRRSSLSVMRECGYSVAKMSDLTGMSPSTIQKTLTSER